MNISLQILKLIRVFMVYFYKPIARKIYSFYYRKEDYLKPLPNCKNPLLLTPAHKLADKIRNKEITSYELVTVFIQRIKEVQPLVNCVVKTCFDEALKEAKKVDEILAKPNIPNEYSKENAPLLGVPFSCKECIWVKGQPNTTGLIGRKEIMAPEDADVVKNLKQAGAILTCLTNTSELCMWLESSNYLYGTTKNPYNLSRIVGGSSGGEGCIVSSAGSVLGIGSDIGGSIRMPAFFNGVYGHKPSSNTISNKTQHPPAVGIQDDMLTTGPICRYASDLKLSFKIFAGPNYAAQKFESNIDLKSLKYYYLTNLQGNVLVSDLSKDSRNALDKAVSFVEKSFDKKANEIQLRKFKSAFQIWNSMMRNGKSHTDSFGRLMNEGKPKPVNPLFELLKSIFRVQDKHTLPAIALSIVERLPLLKPEYYIHLGNQLREELKAILGEDGVMIFPSFPIVAPYHNEPLLSYTFDFIYFGIINSLGFPSTQCPMGLSSDGLPTGIQIVANHGCDHLTIKLAEYFEQNLIGWIEP